MRGWKWMAFFTSNKLRDKQESPPALTSAQPYAVYTHGLTGYGVAMGYQTWKMEAQRDKDSLRCLAFLP